MCMYICERKWLKSCHATTPALCPASDRMIWISFHAYAPHVLTP